MSRKLDLHSIHKQAISSFFETFERLAEGGLATDANGKIVWINQKYRVFLGIADQKTILGMERRYDYPEQPSSASSGDWSTNSF